METYEKTTPRQIYENMATALGVNLLDLDDPSSRLFQIGVTDLDPTRVLLNCEHLFIAFGAHGLFSELLDMPTG